MNTILIKTGQLSVLTISVLMLCTIASGQEEEVRRQELRTASIEKMQKRIAEIEEETKSASLERAQALGEEAFGLFGEIDQTFLQMKDSYQQQVVLLNERMRQMWENVENTEGESRESIDKKLALLQADWDRVYNHLTLTHDGHLKQLKKSIANLRGEFSKSASHAQRELETSHFESMVRWEQAHEIFLKISQTFAKTAGDQLAYVQERVQDNPDIKELSERLERVRARYRLSQNRLQQRYLSHLDHLNEELAIRQLQFSATTARDGKQRIRNQLEHLCSRTHTTFEDLQDSYRETTAALEAAVKGLTAKLETVTGREKEEMEEQFAELTSEIKAKKTSLRKSYKSRIEFIDYEVGELNKWISQATEEDKNRFEARIKNLRALAASLNDKSSG